MSRSAEWKIGLNGALNEAVFLGIDVDTEINLAAVTLKLLTLPASGPPPDDRRVQFLFYPIGRIAASLRHENNGDASGNHTSFELPDLAGIVANFRRPIFGWDFFDLDADFETWRARISLDWQDGDRPGRRHSVTFFQHASPRELDLRLWFDGLAAVDATGGILNIGDIIDDGARWWDGLYAGDPRTRGEGISVSDAGEAGAYLRDSRTTPSVADLTSLPKPALSPHELENICIG